MNWSLPSKVWLLRGLAVLMFGAAVLASYQVRLGRQAAATHGDFYLSKTSIESSPNTARPIESILLGERVAGRNPLRHEVDESLPDPDPNTWRLVRLAMTKESGQRLEIELLRPITWIEAKGAAPGDTVFLDLHEMAAVGDALVTSIEACPNIAKGSGNVVTGRFSHQPEGELLSVQLDADVPPIVCTPNHPFWSEDRHQFVRADKLHVGEQLLTQQGPVSVRELLPHPKTACVYNLEIHNEHVYEVSIAGVLVHNSCEHITLGLSTHIDDFTKGVQGKVAAAAEMFPFYSLTKPTDNLWSGTRRAMENTKSIHFNLQGMTQAHFQKFLKGGGKNFVPFPGASNVTNRELYEVLTNSHLLEKTTFYDGIGKIIDAPLDWLKLP